MLNDILSLLKNPLLERLWNKGLEEIIGPLGPLRIAERAGIQPEPWKVAVPQLLEAAVAKDLAAKHENKIALQSANQAIDAILDDWCGTPPRRHPWPFPGPPPWAWQIASELSLIANSLQAGGLRTEVESIAGRVARGGAHR